MLLRFVASHREGLVGPAAIFFCVIRVFIRVDGEVTAFTTAALQNDDADVGEFAKAFSGSLGIRRIGFGDHGGVHEESVVFKSILDFARATLKRGGRGTEDGHLLGRFGEREGVVFVLQQNGTFAC